MQDKMTSFYPLEVALTPTESNPLSLVTLSPFPNVGSRVVLPSFLPRENVVSLCLKQILNCGSLISLDILTLPSDFNSNE